MKKNDTSTYDALIQGRSDYASSLWRDCQTGKVGTFEKLLDLWTQDAKYGVPIKNERCPKYNMVALPDENGNCSLCGEKHPGCF